MFYGNRQCLEFCSPLYINLKLFIFFWFFLRKVLVLILFKKKMITFFSSWSFLTFLKCIFLRKGSAFIKTVRSCKIFFTAGWIVLKSMRSRAFFFPRGKKMNLQHSLHVPPWCINKTWLICSYDSVVVVTAPSLHRR